MNDTTLDPTTAYARSVVSGASVAGRLVKLACQRHLRDLETGGERGLYFDVAAAQHALGFFGYLNLAKNRPFTLYPFNQFIVGSLFGWKCADGYRRFRNAYVEMAKGNAKSPLAAGIGLLGLVADTEPSAECYAAATKRDQSMILFRDAVNIVDATPSLASA